MIVAVMMVIEILGSVVIYETLFYKKAMIYSLHFPRTRLKDDHLRKICVKQFNNLSYLFITKKLINSVVSKFMSLHAFQTYGKKQPNNV